MKPSSYFLLIAFLSAFNFSSCKKPSTQWQRIHDQYRDILETVSPKLGKTLHDRESASDSASLLESRKEFLHWQKEKAKSLLALLPTLHKIPPSARRDMLIIFIMEATGQLNDAHRAIEAFIAHYPKLAIFGQWEKVKLWTREGRTREAMELFPQIEKKVPQDIDLYSTYLNLALTAEDSSIRREYGNKFLSQTDLPENLRPYRTRVILEQARLERLEGNMAKATQILQAALAVESRLAWRIWLEDEINGMEMIGKPAPPFSTPFWTNTGSLDEGRLRLILFWAHWSEASCQELTFAKEQEARFASRGLQVIACTKLYGPSDKDEEIRRIQEILKGRGIQFPVFVSSEGKEFEAFQIRLLPTVILVDAAGKIIGTFISSENHEELVKQIQHLVGVQ